MAKVECPRCRRLLMVPDRAHLRPARCRGCGMIFRVPMLDETEMDNLVAQWARESDDDADEMSGGNGANDVAKSHPLLKHKGEE